MRLNPRNVRFINPAIELGLFSVPLRFRTPGSTLQLLETALIVEGELQKVGYIFGVERFFLSALTEWSIFTVPYSRIEKLKVTHFPILRLLGILLMLISALLIFLSLVEFMKSGFLVTALYLTIAIVIAIPGIVALLYVKPRFSLTIRRPAQRISRLIVEIRSKKIRQEFLRKLQEYRREAARFKQQIAS